jgi:antitoxin (DNA-binding transcriptional repressor) of toxin-antitoxin stability system
MRVYSVTEARQNLAEVLDAAKAEDVIIRRRGGESFVLSLQKRKGSPLDVPGISGSNVSVDDIVDVLREGREQPWLDLSRYDKPTPQQKMQPKAKTK